MAIILALDPLSQLIVAIGTALAAIVGVILKFLPGFLGKMKESKEKGVDGNSAGEQRVAFWTAEIGRLFDEKVRALVDEQEKNAEKAIADMRALLSSRDERILPILEELKKIGSQQVEIQQKQNEILVELVTVSRIGRRA